MDYRRITATVNAETGKFCTADEPTGQVSPANYPRVMLGETVIFCLSFIDSNGDPYPFGASDVFTGGCDSDFDHDTDLIASASAGSFNVAGDWTADATADPTDGEISMRMAFTSQEAIDKLGSSEYIQPYLQINRYKNGSAIPSMPCVSKFTLVNVPMMGEGAPTSPDPEYYTAAQMLSLLSNYLALNQTLGGTAYTITPELDGTVPTLKFKED